jgi:hypothetical protein
MIDYNKSSGILQAKAIEGFNEAGGNDYVVPVYDCYLEPIKDYKSSVVYVTTSPNFKLIEFLSSYFEDPGANVNVVTSECGNLKGKKVLVYCNDKDEFGSSIMNHYREMPGVDSIIHELDLPIKIQASVFVNGFRAMAPGGVYIVKNMTSDPETSKLVKYIFTLTKNNFGIEFIRNYNSGKVIVVKKIKA